MSNFNLPPGCGEGDIAPRSPRRPRRQNNSCEDLDPASAKGRRQAQIRRAMLDRAMLEKVLNSLNEPKHRKSQTP